MTFKKFIFQLHKILGLTTGLVVFVVAITGCCWVFQDEIESLHDDYKAVTPQNKPFLTPTEAQEIAQEVFPNNAIHGTIFKKADEAIEVVFYESEPEFYQSVFLNPYTGHIIRVNDQLSGFFAFVLKGHTRLWLPKVIGEQVVSVSILIFMLILISGVILWFPKKRNNLKQRLKFDWKKSTRWKRKNFDLHAIIGFYVCSLALILAFTGLIMSYNWLQKTVYLTLGGDKNPTFLIPESSRRKNYENTAAGAPIDRLLAKLIAEKPNAQSFEIHYPHSKSEAIYVEVSNSKGLYYDSDFLFFDQNTLDNIASKTIYGRYKNAAVADQILRMNYDIHIGAIGGIFGKIIVFLVSLLTASLPVTGFFLWYGRNYKKKSNRLNV